MANIAPGVSGTFKQTTAEGRALECLMFVQLLEANEATNPENQKNIQASINTNDRIFEGSFRLPANQTINGEGNLVIMATSYLTGISVTPGQDNPTFKNTRPEGYLLEVLMYLQMLELNPAKNLQRSNRITGSFNSDQNLYSGTFQLPINLGLAPDGSIGVSAQEYLQT